VLSNKKPAHRKGQVQLIDASQWFKPLRKNLGKKNCELSPEDIERISRTFLDFKETPESKIFANAAFGYWKVTVERPLRLHSRLSLKSIETLRFTSGDEDLRASLYEEFGDDLFSKFDTVSAALEKRLADWSSDEDEGDDEEGASTKKGLPEKKRKKLLDPKTWERDGRLVEVATKLREALGDTLFEDHNIFRDRVDAGLKKADIKLAAADLKQMLKAVSWRVETAPPVIAKVHKPGKTKADQLRGLFAATVDGKATIVEYEPDPDLRDTEQVPLLEDGGIEAFIRREVLPYTPDLPAPRPMPGQFCVYVLKCADDSFYVGQTDNFARRLEQHEKGEVSWTGPRLPVDPIHWEVLPSREEAVKREDELKTGFGRQWLKKQYAEGKLYAAAARQAGAWIKEGATKIGYEVSFTRHFYKPRPLRTLEEISADILAIEKEAEGLLEDLLKGRQ
jgi:predicted GIY-YIG superfamily endonuclease